MKKEKRVEKTPFQKLISALDSFFNDDTTYYAASLSFFTIFSILPIIALAISIVSSLPQFDNYIEIFMQYILELLNPTHSKQFITQIENFISNSNHLGSIGIIYMLFVFTMFFKDFEYIVNKIHKAKRKSIYASFFFYLSFILVFPILFVAYLVMIALFDNAFFNFLLSFCFAWIIFFGLFKLTVNRYIDNKAALISSFLTLVTLSVTKNLFVYYVVYNKTYTTIYGSLATLLFFFFWIYISWIIYLYGVKLCHQLNIKALSHRFKTNTHVD
ncbi:YihY/virulence factor BrkB family protein [Candidatus Marinarcus aquaticus]|uniref:Trehalose-6-phosphate synthase n=1 Tax=Candidatus Marinarcus aquaticus TaxID=2044504 RepID=A0A4Q0XNT9_9BACT|nr:YihY/virulence factor BrkB family protein [Candidatus Marinarcus aquaticus]RXJ55222.1 trehalose-6-phosphate synthase [Candidatus Marinarcus aquaticus]